LTDLDVASVTIKATSSSGSTVERSINITEVTSGSYNFIGLDEQLDWKFEIVGTFGDGSQEEGQIVFAWKENEEDHDNEGIRPGPDRDKDRRANSVDPDDDNDDILDRSDSCPIGEINWKSNANTDNDGDGCRDRDEDADDDNDLLLDNHTREQLINSVDGSCSLLPDCDNDNITDRDEAADHCVLIKTDCDMDLIGDLSDSCPAGETGWTSNGSSDYDGDGCRDAGEDIDDDGDGLIEIATAAELDKVRYALRGNGIRLSEGGELNTTGCGDGDIINSCAGYELVANISLDAYSDGEGWDPLGKDKDLSDTVGCRGDAFTGTFEGNGFMISNLSINRPDEDCVGLFGQIDVGATIRNLILRAERVIGKSNVGGLVGYSDSGRIASTAVVAREVTGNANNVGGLVGYGEGSGIISSSVVVETVKGSSDARVALDDLDNVGGLVGNGLRSGIVSSSVVVGKVEGRILTGGLLGNGPEARIASTAVVASVVTAGGGLSGGGLVGNFNAAQLAYSYLVIGSTNNRITVLAASGSGNEVASYWDSNTSDINIGDTARISFGSPKTSNELRMPTNYTGIYAKWNNHTDVFFVLDPNNSNQAILDEPVPEPLAVWCDEDNSENIEQNEQTNGNRVCDFGTADEYPAIRCTPITPAEWRSWWFLDGTGQPQLNQARLDALLP